MVEKFNTNQQEYWDKQHKDRQKESVELESVPNDFAKKCLKYIKPGGKVLEIGIANGRDSRYFVRENKNNIIGVDISTEAIRQLIEAALRDGTISKILPVVAEANEIPSLLKNQEYYDAFYSRSALHLDDEKISPFLTYITSHLNENGVIMIEGKTKEDSKIERSVEVGKNCFEDVDGHIRRVWSEKDIIDLCEYFNLEIIEIGRTTEIWQGKETKFIHFIAKKKNYVK